MSSTWLKSGPFKSLGSLSNHDDHGNEIPHKFAYLIMKNSILHALHVHFSFLDLLKTFSFFLPRGDDLVRELKQPRRRRQQKPHKFAYLTMKKRIFARFARVFFYLLTFWRRSRSFYDVKWPVLQLCGRRAHMMTNVQFCPLMSQALVPI